MKTLKYPLLLVGILLFCALAVGTATAEECCPDDGCCPPPPPPSCCGCTPGFWKNHLDAWPERMDPDQLFIPDDSFKDGIDLNGDEISDTLLDALNYRGGSGVEGAQRILARAWVAAYLNEVTFGKNYPAIFSTWLECETTFIGGDREAMIALAEQLDAWNNGVCPL